MPRVSVVLPTHNRPGLLSQALASVVAQTFSDWEALIVDDASEPPVEIDLPDRRMKVRRHDSSRGGAAAKNTGIENANGEILAFLDDDDLYAPQYLQRAVDVLDRNPELDAVFMGVSWFGAAGLWGQRNYDEAMRKCMADARGRVIGPGEVAFDEDLFGALLKSVPMAFQRPVVRKRALQRIGRYRPHCLLWDCDWAISAALKARTALVTDGLYLQRAEGQGYSSKSDRKLDQLNSGIEIKERFLREARAGSHSPHTVPKLRESLAKAWFNLACHHYQQDNQQQALSALWRSERTQFSMNNLKLLVRLMLPVPR